MVEYFSRELMGLKHKFILIGNSPNNNEVYLNVENCKSIDYTLLNNISELKPLNKKLRHHDVYLHGVPYSWMIYLIINRYKSINWICWGAGAILNYKNYKSILFYPIKNIIYKRFKRIGVLMPQDQNNLEKYFNLKNIFLLSYAGSLNNFPYDLGKLYENKYNSNVVYIGNNSSSINSYMGVAKSLSTFDNIYLVCMLNYSFKESNVSKDLMDYGKSSFGDKFRFDTELYSLNDYYDYMDSCDIYICAIKKQTGLGAIYTSLRLGKKIYLTGQNYEWITSLGCEIFHVDELKSISENDFLTSISLENKIKNYKIIANLSDGQRIVNQWEFFFNEN
jgi:hypothetical protein